jgi:GNAT superfamily N-acetyltransferase
VLSRLSRLLADPAAFLYVAETDGEAIGFASGYAMPLIQRDPAGRLAALVVTSAAHRTDAHGFYERLGFVDKPRRYVKQL